VGGPPLRRIEDFLPTLPEAGGLEPVLRRLLEGGRGAISSFDTSPSPLAAFLYCALGEAQTQAGFEASKRWWAGQLSTTDYLRSLPGQTTRAIALAAVEIATTRRETLESLAKSFVARAST
jgi:hypothetical protein